MATWQAAKGQTEHGDVENLIADDGTTIAFVIDFGYANYPHAFDPEKQEWIRRGAVRDGVEAKLWAERVAGLHPQKPSDMKRGPQC